MTNSLYLNKLEDGLPGVTPAWGKFLCEASSLCFKTQNHYQGVELKVHGQSSTTLKVFWKNEISEETHNSWDDLQELTEYGACGVAILLILKLTNFTVIRRARKGTGIDYWLGHTNQDKPFQNSARLEISGILKGEAKSIKARVDKKKRQTQPSDGPLPAYVVVVEFSKPLSHMVEK